MAPAPVALSQVCPLMGGWLHCREGAGLSPRGQGPSCLPSQKRLGTSLGEVQPGIPPFLEGPEQLNCQGRGPHREEAQIEHKMPGSSAGGSPWGSWVLASCSLDRALSPGAGTSPAHQDAPHVGSRAEVGYTEAQGIPLPGVSCGLKKGPLG